MSIVVVADVVPFFSGRRPIVRWPRNEGPYPQHGCHVFFLFPSCHAHKPVPGSGESVVVWRSFSFFAHLPCDSLSGPHAQLVSPTSRLADFTSRRTNGYVPYHGSVNFHPPAAHECVLLQVTQASALAPSGHPGFRSPSLNGNGYRYACRLSL